MALLAVIQEGAFVSAPHAFPMVAQRMDITKKADKHTHDFMELAFILRGKATHSCAHGTEQVSAGMVVLTGIGAWHAYTPDPSVSLLVLRIGPALLETSLSWCSTLDTIGPIFDPTVDESAALKVAVGRLDPFAVSIIAPALSDLANVRPSARGSMFYRISRFFEVLHGIHDIWNTEPIAESTSCGPSHADTAPHRPRRVVRPEVRQAVAAMRENLGAPVTIETIARIVGLSMSQLERVFAADLGVSPTGYLTELRFREFTRLLRETRFTVTDAARQVGWQSASHAGDVLRRRAGMTPTQYRREHNAHEF